MKTIEIVVSPAALASEPPVKVPGVKFAKTLSR